MDHQLRFIRVIALHSADLAGHSSRVGGFAGQVAAALGADNHVDLGRAAELHDLGKLGIPDAILNKPSALSTGEYRLVQEHALIGGKALSEGTTAFQRLACDAARSHHERWDGRGYPDGLDRQHIPLVAQVAAVADTYDALMSHRIYRRSRFELEQVLAVIVAEREKQFAPEVVDAFFLALPAILSALEAPREAPCWLTASELTADVQRAAPSV